TLNLTLVFFFHRPADPQDLHSFPTRRSSDLAALDTSRLAAMAGIRDIRREADRVLVNAAELHRAVPAVLGELGRQGVPLTELRRSEEHTSELQSLAYLVCRLLLEKKKKKLTN